MHQTLKKNLHRPIASSTGTHVVATRRSASAILDGSSVHLWARRRMRSSASSRLSVKPALGRATASPVRLSSTASHTSAVSACNARRTSSANSFGDLPCHPVRPWRAASDTAYASTRASTTERICGRATAHTTALCARRPAPPWASPTSGRSATLYLGSPAMALGGSTDVLS